MEDHIVEARGLGVDAHRLCLVEHIREGLAARQPSARTSIPSSLVMRFREFQHHPDRQTWFRPEPAPSETTPSGTAFAVAVSAPLFEDHRSRQDKVSRVYGERRVAGPPPR